jgi:hypothetical protein
MGSPLVLVGVAGAIFLVAGLTLSDGAHWSWWLLAAVVSFLAAFVVLSNRRVLVGR